MNRSKLIVVMIGGLIGLIAYIWTASLIATSRDASEANARARTAEQRAAELQATLNHIQSENQDRADAVISLIRAMEKDHDALLKAIRENRSAIIRIQSEPDVGSAGNPDPPPKPKKKPKDEPPRGRLIAFICLLVPFFC